MLPGGDIVGTAIIVVLFTTGALPVGGPPGPPRLLIVGMPRIVAGRGGPLSSCAAGAFAAAVAAAGLAAATLPAAAGLADDPLVTISPTFSSMVCVSHGLGKLASAPTEPPLAAS